MVGYKAPLEDIAFVMNDLGILDNVTELPEFGEVSDELVVSILDAAGKFASEILVPINQSGDREGCRLENNVVYTPKGFREAYSKFTTDGWAGLTGKTSYGGQNLPTLVSVATKEIWTSANMAWSLCPSLSQGAIELLSAHGSSAQKKLYLPPLISGEWTGCMNLTESHAGSDLGHIRCQAIHNNDHYKIRGQKIFITWGEHDLANNIIHLVLARTPGAPPGVKGISLFIVPKLLPGPDGNSSVANDLRCVSIEHKLGIHASPTCIMSYGDSEGATGFLVGEENRGLEYMFTMMNRERLSVGLQGLALAERAYQQARNFSLERLQGRSNSHVGAAQVTIINHPDIRRMLLTIRSQIEAMRAVIYDTAAMIDVANFHTDLRIRLETKARVDLLTPVIKAWCTDVGVELVSMAMQIHGGVGYIEETGMAQHFRDVRIGPIYEGTNGIQAKDLINRKIIRDDGAAAYAFIKYVRTQVSKLGGDENSTRISRHLESAVRALERTTHWLVKSSTNNPAGVEAGAGNYLRLMGQVAGGALLAKTARSAQQSSNQGKSNTGFYKSKIVNARFYAEHILSQSSALLTPITEGHAPILELSNEDF